MVILEIIMCAIEITAAKQRPKTTIGPDKCVRTFTEMHKGARKDNHHGNEHTRVSNNLRVRKAIVAS